MAKEKQQETKDYSVRKLSDNDIKDLSLMIKQAGGVTNFLIKNKVLKQKEDGELVVQMYTGLGESLTEAYAGIYYTTDVPLNTWNLILEQVENYWKRRKYAEEHENKKVTPKTDNIEF